MAATPARAEPVPADLTPNQLQDIYYYLILTRRLEERLVNLYRQGKVIGGLYRSLGQEGESVGAAYALQSGDVMSPLIRNLGAMLVMGARPLDVLRQYMAKSTGPTKGRDMNLHFDDLQLGYLGQISPLGDMIPVMAGITLSFKMRDEARVGLVFIGDGGTSTGTFHEGVNLAAVLHLPLVVVLEDNGFAYSTPRRKQTAVARLALKAKTYGVPATTIDGNDVLGVYQATRAAVARARAGDGVSLIEVVTYRRKGHAEHDDQRYQGTDEIAQWAENDPIERFRRRVEEAAWVSDHELRHIDARVEAELAEAVEACEGDPLPDPASALSDVYHDPSAAGRLWFRSING
jgi:TPP-dependent pyruvate/acetoin dehydrogenase alpha subunit